MPPLQWGRNLSCRGVLLRSRGFAFAKPLSPHRTTLPEIRHFPAGGMNAFPYNGGEISAVGECFCAPVLLRQQKYLPRSKKTILLPLLVIIGHIIPNLFIFQLIPDHMVMKGSLPHFQIRVHFSDSTTHTGFI